MSEERITVRVESVSLNEEAGAAICFVTLQDEAGRQMRVFIGKVEGLALSLSLQKYSPVRPLTYEAMLSCLAAAGATVENVYINDLRDETFYAAVSLRVDEQIHPVDMRPSDALNLAVRTKCPLFVSEKVFLACQSSEEPSDVAVPAEAHFVTVTRPAQELITLSDTEVSEELARLFKEDQSDRMPQPPGQIDWSVVGPRDAVRLARVKQFYHGQVLQTGMDFYHAAMILQHAHMPEDFLLAHEFCVVAVSRGVEQAKWLAAASEDRFLMNMEQPQRFGTQYRIDGRDGRWSLYEVSAEVEDSLRSAFDVPSLFQAQTHMDEMNTKSV